MADTDELWQEYARTRDRGLREQLILQYAPLVRYVLGRLAIHVPWLLDSADLLGHGTVGLIVAVDRFDPSCGVKFETYAIQRVRGSIIDALRAMGTLSRDGVGKARLIEKAIANLEQEQQRSPTHHEIAERLNLPVEELDSWIAQSSHAFISLDSPLHVADPDDTSSLSDVLADESSPNPAAVVENQELRRALVGALRNLPERDRQVLSLYYHDELTLREIGQVMGISESRVHQLHARAILRLRASLRVVLRVRSRAKVGVT